MLPVQLQMIIRTVYAEKTPDEVCSGSEKAVASMLHWFGINFMQASKPVKPLSVYVVW